MNDAVNNNGTAAPPSLLTLYRAPRGHRGHGFPPGAVPGALSFKQMGKRPWEQLGPEPREGPSSGEQTRQLVDSSTPTRRDGAGTKVAARSLDPPLPAQEPPGSPRLALLGRPLAADPGGRGAPGGTAVATAFPSSAGESGFCRGPARRGSSVALRALASPAWPRVSACHLERV